MAKVDTGELDQQAIAPAKLHPNQWNPNRMDDKTLQAERESIATYGFIDPITVRPLKGKRGHFEIIDGEHRWKVATEEKLKKVPCVVLKLDDTAARKLTIVLNETRGQADTVLLSSLLTELQADLGDELGVGLRWSEPELESILKVSDDDWDGYDPEGLHEVSFTATDAFTIQAKLPKEFKEVWEKLVAKIEADQDLSDDARLRNGQVVMLAVRAFLGEK